MSVRYIGRYEQQRVWLWLIAAAKHGLPFRRLEQTHYGRALRGRLLACETALFRAVGDNRLASLTRARVVDPVIGGILLTAFTRLGVALGPRGEKNYWLPDRGKTLVDELQSALSGSANVKTTGGHAIVRYSPITENYRSDLSLSILAHRPPMAVSGGDRKAFGVLLDMAEIWELYVAKLLQKGLASLRVSHTGRCRRYLCWNDSGTLQRHQLI